MDLTPDQAAKAKILFEYEEAKKALTERRDNIQIWAKALIAAGEALMNHPGTIVIDGAAGLSNESEPQACLGSSGHSNESPAGIDRNHLSLRNGHQIEEEAPHCDARYLNADRLGTLVTEFRENSQLVIELD